MLEENIENAFLNARRQIKKACALYSDCRHDEDKYEIISHPRRIIEVNIPVRMDNWRIKTFTWYRSQHNDARWPFKWGIRFHQDVSMDEVKALSMWMSFKCSVVDIPLGWAKWWIIVNPKELSIWELERLSRGYVREIYKYIGPMQDIPAPDVNTTPQIMAWMMDEYSKLIGIYSPGTFTWKPISSGWSLGRDKATAQWWVFVLEKILELKNIELSWKKIIIQWAGNAWLTMLKLLKDKWVTIVGIADSNWAIYNENWLYLDAIITLKKARKSVIEFWNSTIMSALEILEMPCDILIPAALENQINEKNAPKIKASIILELANWPITEKADEILFSAGVTVIPDILANAGWVMVSYFEQVQNNTNYYWSLEEVDSKLYDKITKATTDVFNTAVEFSTFLRSAAYIIALRRIFAAMKDRGEI